MSDSARFFTKHIVETASTMIEARRLQSEWHSRGIVFADYQTAGRGRGLGRSWQAAAGTALLASFWFPSADFQSRPVTLLAARAVVLALQALCPDLSGKLQVKWPNDIIINNGKLAGILGECTSESVFLGIGINLLAAPQIDNFKLPPAALSDYTHLIPERKVLSWEIMQKLQASPNDALVDMIPRLWGTDRILCFYPGFENQLPIEGVIKGLTSEGALVFETATDSRIFHSGEIGNGI